MAWKERFFQWYEQIWRFLIHLNVFRSYFAPTTNQFEIKTQIIATRVYLILLAASLLILITYTSELNVSETITVKDVTYDQFLSLNSAHSKTLSCPCTILSISYDQFIYLDASYHQVCDSIYTTSDWRYLIDSTSSDNVTSFNFRYLGSSLFAALSSFCRLSQTTVVDGIIGFNTTQFISVTTLSLDLYDSIVEDLIRLFISQITRDFTLSRQLFRDQIQYNGIMSGLFTNFYYETRIEPITSGQYLYEFHSISRVFVDQVSNCSCDNTPFCKIPAFIDDQNSFVVPGVYYGCYIVESLLQSNLGCFYNQSCIDEFLQAFNSSIILNTTALDSTVPSRYAFNETIEVLVNQLMVEQWINRSSHHLYYDRCRPSQCLYTLSSRKDWVTVITSIIIPIGGLNLILKIIIPWLITMFRSRRFENSEQSLPPQNYHLLRLVKTYILRLNLFQNLSHSTMEEEYTIRTQIITTRVYLISLIVSLFVLIVYRAQVLLTRSAIVTAPSYTEYTNLYNNYSQSLSCPCTNVNIQYDQFIQIDVQLHQVCTSSFVSDRYFAYLNPSIIYVLYGDVRRGKSQLQMIGSWCQLANSSVIDDRTAFYAEQMTVYEAISLELFNEQIQSLTSVFSRSTKDVFLRSLAVIRQMTEGNILASGYITNVLFYAVGNSSSLTFYRGNAFYPQSITCICGPSQNCTEPMTDIPTNQQQYTPSLIFEGLLRGCLVDEATLQSTLQCYYNQTCLDNSYSILGLNLSSNFPTLNSTLSIQFNDTSVIGDILQQMMVDNWTYTSSHLSFYNACRPLSCSYVYVGRNDISVIVSSIIGLIGGLTTILKVIIPLLMKFVRRFQRNPGRLINHLTESIRTEHVGQYWNKGQEMIVKFNIFHSSQPGTIVSRFELKTQIVSTRVFFIFLFVPLLILAIYTSQVSVPSTITVHKPSYDSYSLMYLNHSQSLACPCTTVSIRYDQFLQVKAARFHQVCRSVYATKSWASLISASRRRHNIYSYDFRDSGSLFFQLLASFCDQSRETINGELIKFNAQGFVTKDVMTQNLFQSQVDSYMQIFIASTKRAFGRSIQLVRELTQANVLFSPIANTLHFNVIVGTGGDVALSTGYTTFSDSSSNCSCRQTSECIVSATIFYDISYAPTPVVRFVVPGIMRGCYITEALFHSNLVCFYNQSCVDDLRRALNTTQILGITIVLNTTALDSSLASQFRVDSTFNEIISELMVEEWTKISSHIDYYTACNPKVCTYSVIDKNNFITVIATIIGLLGSLTTILMFVVPAAVKSILKQLRKCQNRIASEE